MPQTTYMPLFLASYPILAKAQKPGGVTISTTLAPGATPNMAVGPAVAEQQQTATPAKSKK